MEENISSVVEDVKNDVTEPTVNGKEEKKVVPLSEHIELRKKKQELEKKLREIEEAESLKKGEYESLLAKYKSELENMQLTLAEKEKLVEKWLNYESKQREYYKNILGDMPDIDKMSLEQLDYLAKKLTTKVPDTNTAPPNPKTPSQYVMTERDKQRAKEMFSHLSEDEAYKAYIKVKERITKK